MSILQFVLACWLIFISYWMISAAAVKPIEKTSGWLAGNWYTILFLIGFAFIVGFRSLGRPGMSVGALSLSRLPHTALVASLTILFLLGGLIIAILARPTLAANRSRQVAIKEGHELITQGLYAYVRNPIYTGILLITFGTALVFGTWSAAIGFLIVVLGIYLKYRDEERILGRHFGTQCSSYKQRTKALIPFLW